MWRGSSKINRRSILANQGIFVKQSANSRSFPWGGLATALGAVLIFFGVVIGLAVVPPPAIRICKAMRGSVGLKGDQTLVSCTREVAVDGLLAWQRR